MTDLKFFQNKNVLITGHTGFKGTWLARILLNAGANVTGYALEPPTSPSLFELMHLDKEIHSVIGDIRDLSRLKQVFEEVQPEIVLHLAAQPIVRDSYKDPVYTYETNVMGTVNICECVRLNPCVKSFLNVTTDKVYHNREWEWGYRETDPLDGYDPYSNSKSCSELVTHSYKKSFFEDGRCAISTSRAGNVIGGGDWAKDRLIPDIVRALHSGEEIVLRNPAAVRPWQHVLEPLGGYLLLGYLASVRYDDLSDAYNFGPNPEDTLTVEQMTALATDIWGIGKYRVEQDLSAPHEAGLLKLDISLAKAELEWKPGMNAHKALELTLQWYKTYYQNKESISALTERQIQYFFSK